MVEWWDRSYGSHSHKRDITVKTPAAAVAARLLRDILMQKSTAFHDGDRLRDGGAGEKSDHYGEKKFIVGDTENMFPFYV